MISFEMIRRSGLRIGWEGLTLLSWERGRQEDICLSRYGRKNITLLQQILDLEDG
jgi:hypothetical protein